MTEYRQGATASLTVQWRGYPGGPAVAVTGVQVTISPVGGGTAVVGPTGTGVVTEATGLNSYAWTVPAAQTPGDYLVLWTGTDPDAETVQASEVVTVVEAAGPGRVYATAADLADWLGLTSPPAGASRMIRAASRDVDQLLLTAVYDVDAAGLPTTPAHIAALRDATCAQAEYARGRGDAYGVGAGHIKQASIGSVSFQRGGATGGEAPGRYSPQAYEILQQAGLTGHEPQAPWGVW